MHLIHDKKRVFEEFGLASETVRGKLAGKVIDDDFWCNVPIT
jgi:hypothetical protein